MDEFNNRMDAQRSVIELINHSTKSKNEELCGLSKNAIERWLNANTVSANSDIGLILFEISRKLFFLSTKSQEQITEDYRILSSQIQELQLKLANALVIS